MHYFFQLIALYYIIKYYEESGRKEREITEIGFGIKASKFILLAGISSGLSYWCKSNVGIYNLAGCLIILPVLSIIRGG